MSLYEALTRSGKGGPIADAIVEYGNQSELEDWCINAIPSALGPLLRTLSSPPEALSVNSEGSKRTYPQSEAHALQQKAIERVLGWIVKNAQKNNTIDKAQSQFEMACMSMNEFGVRAANSEQDYCKNRFALDSFMAEGVQNLLDKQSNSARERYKNHVKLLGANLSEYCQKNFVPRPNYSSSGASPFLRNF
ncbi:MULTISPECIES: hypothetical protein [unclassified Pseudomonas]|jgi:hypothetical protein